MRNCNFFQKHYCDYNTVVHRVTNFSEQTCFKLRMFKLRTEVRQNFCLKEHISGISIEFLHVLLIYLRSPPVGTQTAITNTETLNYLEELFWLRENIVAHIK